MKLSPEQEALVRQWAADGDSLSDIQSKLASECDVHMSYLDVRFLVMDLSVTIAEKNSKSAEPVDVKAAAVAAESPAGPYAAAAPAEEAAPAEPAPAPAAAEPAPAAADGVVTVNLSRIQRPGFSVSGDVTFSDGVVCDWGITNDGRIALDPKNGDTKYRPSASDVQMFQTQLRNLLMGGAY